MSAADHLNPRQHKDFIYTHVQDESESGMRFDDYRLIRRTANELGDVRHEQVGHLTVDRSPGKTEGIGAVPSKPSAYDEDWYRSGPSTTSTPVTAMVPHPRYGPYPKTIGRQGRLFEYRPPSASRHEVNLLAGTRQHRAANMVMLGMAENAARSEGTTLRPSEDLSEHSSRLVEHLKGKGVVSERAETAVTNEMQFTDPYSLGRSSEALKHRAPQEQVEAGRKTVREIVRGDKPRKIKGQGSLF